MGIFSGAILIDLRKAFDTVYHDIVSAKLGLYGADGVELECFISYLRIRKRCFKVNGNTSEIQDIKCGVHQGSYSDPLLLFILISICLTMYYGHYVC